MPSEVAPALFKAVVGLSYDAAGYWFIHVNDPAGGKANICINRDNNVPFHTRMAFVRWAASRMDNAAQPVTMLTPIDEESLLDAENAPLLDEAEIERVFKALTNGVGEIPYAQEDVMDLGGGDVDSCGWSIYVADGQLLASVAPIADPAGYETEIVYGICKAGRAIQQLRAERDYLMRELAACRARSPEFTAVQT